MTDNHVTISVRNLRKTYRDGLLARREVKALDGVSLEVRRGEVFGLLGPNGAGKTTLIKILLGIVRKTAGEASLLGYAAGQRQGRVRVGYLPEHHRIPRHLTGNTALEYYGGLSDVPVGEIRSRRGGLLEMVGLADWGGVSVKKYSKGMQQRLGLAQCLVHDPEVLILDEPTDGVDPVGRREMRVLLERLRQQGKTIFLNSHLLQEVELICDRVAILDHGQVRRIGNVDELTSQQTDQVTLTVLADQSAARTALSGRRILQATPSAGNHVTLQLAVADTGELDACVDALRAAGISITGIARQRQTLEDAFLHIIQPQTAQVVATAVAQPAPPPSPPARS